MSQRISVDENLEIFYSTHAMRVMCESFSTRHMFTDKVENTNFSIKRKIIV